MDNIFATKLESLVSDAPPASANGTSQWANAVFHIRGAEHGNDDNNLLNIESLPFDVVSIGGEKLFSIRHRLKGCVLCPLSPYMHTASQILSGVSDSALRVVFYSTRVTTTSIVHLMRLGASSVLAIPDDLGVLADAIRCACRESSLVLRKQQKNQDLRSRFYALTHDEKLLLLDLMNGRSNKQISFELGASLRTIESRKRRLLAKTNSRNVADLFLSFHDYSSLCTPSTHLAAT